VHTDDYVISAQVMLINVDVNVSSQDSLLLWQL